MRACFFLFSLLFSFHIQAQNVTDSLRAVLAQDLTDSVRVEVLNNLASKYFYRNPSQTDSLATLSIALARSGDHAIGLITALRYKGISHAIRGHFDQARDYYFEALELTDPYPKEKPALYYAIGITYAETGKHELAEESYKKSLALQKSFADSIGTANCYVGLANFHKKISQFKRSILYLDSAADIYIKLNRPLELSIVRHNQSNVFVSTNNYPKALEYAQEALTYNLKEGLDQKTAISYHAIGNIYGYLEESEQAAAYYMKSYQLKKKLGMGQGMAFSLSNIGAMYLQQQKYDEAKTTFLQVRSLYDSLNIVCNLPYVDLSLGSVYQETGRKDSAYFYLQRSLKTSEVCQSEDVTAPVLVRLGEMYLADQEPDKAESAFLKALEISNRAGLLAVKAGVANQLYKFYKQKGAIHRAFGYLEISKSLRDSIYNEENARRIARLESKYEFDKEKAILQEQFEKEKVIQAAEVEKQILIRDTAIIIASLLMALVIGTIVFYFKLKQRKTLLLQRNQEITRQKERLEELNQTNDKLLSLLSHDLRSPLHGMQSLITLWRDEYLTKEELDQISIDVETRIRNLLQFLDNILGWSRNNFTKLEAKKALLDLTKVVEETILLLQPNADLKKISIEFVPDRPYELAADEVMLKIIFRNILSNAIKYSKENSTVQVRISSINGWSRLEVKDQGVGMSEAVKNNLFKDTVASKEGTKNEMGAGIGLYLCKDFVALHAGTIEVVSEEGKGSTFTVVLPNQTE